MARIGKYRVSMNTKAKPFAIIMNIVMLFIWLYIGDQVIDSVMTIMRTNIYSDAGVEYARFVPTTNSFYNAFQLFGVQGSTTTNGLVGVIGLLLGVGVLMQAIKVTRL